MRECSGSRGFCGAPLGCFALGAICIRPARDWKIRLPVAPSFTGSSHSSYCQSCSPASTVDSGVCDIDTALHVHNATLASIEYRRLVHQRMMLIATAGNHR